MYGHVLQHLAQGFCVLWYDTRGTGMSDRSALDFSLEAMERDLEAVTAAAGMDQFALLAWSLSVPIAISYTTKHPEQVSHLIFVDGTPNPNDRTPSMEAEFKASRGLLSVDWTLFTEGVAKLFMGVEDSEYVKRFAEHYRECIDRDALLALDAGTQTCDVSALLRGVDAPALIIQNETNRWMPIKYGQQLAAGIKGALAPALNRTSR